MCLLSLLRGVCSHFSVGPIVTQPGVYVQVDETKYEHEVEADFQSLKTSNSLQTLNNTNSQSVL